jgi:DNA-binding LacI/PurR family transcriptional regulator
VGLFRVAQTAISLGWLKSAGIPTIVLGRSKNAQESVIVDQAGGIFEAIRHLVQSGRKRVAYFMPHTDNRSRLDGYERAIREFGLPSLVMRFSADVPMASRIEELVARCLALNPRPDAIQAHTDFHAMKILAALHKRGVAVPEEMAVVGYDDRSFAAWAHPPLTTVAQPCREVGARAAELLLQQIAGDPPPGGGGPLTVKARLVVRESG